MLKLTTIIVCLTISIVVNCQESFSLLVDGANWEQPNDLTIDEQGNYIVIGSSFDDETFNYNAFALKVSASGNIITNKIFEFVDSTCLFGHILKTDSNYLIIGGIGPSSIGLSSLLICSMDFDLNLLWRRSYKFPNQHISGSTSAKFDIDGNIVVMGSVFKEVKYLDPDPYEFKLSPFGDSILMVVHELDQSQLVWDFLIKPDTSGYISFARGRYHPNPHIEGQGVYHDTAFSIQGIKEVPSELYDAHTVRWIDNTSFCISGKKILHNPIKRGMGLMKLDTSFSVLDEAFFGFFTDTTSYPGWGRNYDYQDLNNIYFIGTKNLEDSPQSMPSWIMLFKLDSDLNIVWERFYGGDAMYVSWVVSATEDGGCIIAGTRYDYNLSGFDFDVYLIKTDENGLITTINEDGVINDVDVFVSPNPCTDKITFNKDLSLIEIFNQSGQMILRFENYSISKSIIVHYFKQGIYIYRIIDKEGYLATGKLIKK